MSTYHNQAITYRPEIDGLRAVAVLPVILFHAGFELFSGGYVGVDVFFVISGYLITSIILREMEQGKFSITRFYERRARRILPALFFVIACCLPFAWMWMLPDELKRFGQSMVAVATFSSNIYFWRNTDYFAPSAEEQPLLHTWSLAVEEQYYVLFPLFLMLCWRFGKSKVFWLIAMAAVLSFALAEWGWRSSPTANFYLLPTRAWELLAGSLLAFIPKEMANRFSMGEIGNLASLLGLNLILFSIFAFDSSTPFPSIYALVPVLGTVLVIIFASPKNFVGWILSAKGIVGIGLISYSAYLWHQPILAFLKLISVGEHIQWKAGVALAVTFVLAFFTHRLVEIPFRSVAGWFSKRLKIFSLSLSILLAFAATGYVLHMNQGFDARLEAHNSIEWTRFLSVNHGLDEECEYTNRFTLKDKCVEGSEPNTILWGDSFAMHLAQGMAQNEISFIQATRSDCGPSFFDAPIPNRSGSNLAWSEKCFEFNQSILAFIKKNTGIKYVVMASPFKQYLEGNFFNPNQGSYRPSREERVGSFLRTIELLVDLGIQPIIISPPPSPGFNVGTCLSRNASGLLIIGKFAKSCDFFLASVPKQTSEVSKFVDDISTAAAIPQIDLTDLICEDGTKCVTRIGNVPLYRDGGHLSKIGSTLLAEKFRVFDRLK